MDRHQAGQEETLVKMEMDSLEDSRPRRTSRACFRWAVALGVLVVLVVIVVLVLVFFIPQYFLRNPCNQESLSHPLQRTDKGVYDIFTAEKYATYLVYGWVTFSNVTNDEITLRTNTNVTGTRTLQKTMINQTEMFFFSKVKLVAGYKIQIVFSPDYVNSSFHIHEL